MAGDFSEVLCSMSMKMVHGTDKLWEPSLEQTSAVLDHSFGFVLMLCG